MNLESIAETLFVETSLFSSLLLLFLLIDSIVVYKMSFKDKISLILISTIALSIFDGIWHFVDGNPSQIFLNYLCAYVYAFCLVFGTSMLCLFSLERFRLENRFQKWKVLLFAVPNVLTALACVTNPWTKFIYSIDEKGDIQYLTGFDYFVVPLCLIYCFAAILLALYHVIANRKKNRPKAFYARNLLIFALLSVGVECVQAYVLEVDENYLVTSLSWAIGLLFFTTRVNTDRFVRNREKMAAVESDLQLAANIQLGALPTVVHALPRHSDISVYATMQAAKEVGGDFYDFFEIDESHIGFVIADVSGKGVPAALFMMTVKTMIRDHATMKSSTAQIFTDVNKLLCENNPEEMFATAWIGILDTKTRVMKCTNAGHNAPVFAKKNGEFEFLNQRHGVFLAGFDFTQYKESEIHFESGDCLFIYTDGLTEAHNVSSELYGDERLLHKLNSIEIRGGEPFLTAIKKDVSAFAEDTEQFDDITMMVIKID